MLETAVADTVAEDTSMEARDVESEDAPETGEDLQPSLHIGQPLENQSDLQDIFSDAKIVIPELVLSSSYDLESILSSGLTIHVDIQDMAAVEHDPVDPPTAAAEKEKPSVVRKTQYHAQIDCYQEDTVESGPLGEIHYILEGMDDFCAAYHGYKASKGFRGRDERQESRHEFHYDV